MEKSSVYFADFRATKEDNVPKKLERLMRTAGMDRIDFQNKFVAIKVHFGETGNFAYIRPNYIKVVADLVRKLGGRPFLVDCNTLYVGRRKNALEHMSLAQENGFGPLTTGCHVIIGDGIKGHNETIVPVKGEYLTEAKIGAIVMEADILISVNHVKGHENVGFGGAIKNIGMGCASRGGKMIMHSAGKPNVIAKRCTLCGSCIEECAHEAIALGFDAAEIDSERCVGCGRCVGACPTDAIQTAWDAANEVLGCKISEYALAVLRHKPSFHVSFVMDVTPDCDCHREHDVAIVPDVGMFASADPLALDIACVDAVNRQMPMPGSALDGSADSSDRFTDNYPKTNWRFGMEHAEKIGVGSMDYELIPIR